MATSRSRRASSIRSFSATGHAARSRRRARLLSRIFCRWKLMACRSETVVHDVFALHRAASRLEIIKNGLRPNQQAAGLGTKRHEDVPIEGGNRLKIEGCTHRPSNGVTINDAVGLHLVDRSDDCFDVHIQNLSGNSTALPRLEFSPRGIETE